MQRVRSTAGLLMAVSCALVAVPSTALASSPDATTEAATAVSYEEATLEGSVNPLGSTTKYWFEYGETTSYGTKIPASPESVGSGTSNVPVSSPVTSLKENTTYHFRVVAENEAKEKALGEDAKFTTAGYSFSFPEEGSESGPLSEPFDLAVDSKGNIWVSDTGNNRIVEFNAEGKYISKFGKEGTGNSEFKAPKGIAVDSDDHIWVVDSGNARVQKFDTKGEYLLQFGKEGAGEAEFKSPSGIGVVGSGPNIFVADTGNNRVQKLSPSGKWLVTIGKEGSGNGEFKSPTDVVITSAIYVVDTGNDRVQKFNASSFNFALKFGTKGSGDGQFDSPTGITADFQDRLWVVDSGNDRAEKFNLEGKYQDQIGKSGSGPGQFSNPTGIAAPVPQKTLVVDSGNDRVQNWSVKPEPPSVIARPVTELKASSAVLHANIDPEALATTYWFEYGETTSYGTKIPTTPESIGSGSAVVKVNQTATSLSKEITYHFRAVAKSSAGRTDGADRTFKLMPPKATTEPATEIKATQATLNGKVNPQGSATKYWFEYGTTKSFGTKIPIPAESVGSGFTNAVVSQTPTGLKESTLYYFQLVAESDVDTAYGGEKSFTTEKQSDAITEAATAIKLTQATLNGKVNPLGSATKYWFEYGTTKSYGTKIPVSPESIGSGSEYVAVSQTPTGLKVATEYHFRVVAESGGGKVTGGDRTFKTLPRSLLSFGSSGESEGQFEHPADVAIDAEGNAWVVDMENARLEKFDKEGKYITEFGEEGEGECQLKRPKSVAIDAEGYIWVDDAGNFRVTQFNEAGECFAQFGEMGTGEGQFFDAESIAIDAEGNIWVADTYSGRLQEFDPEEVEKPIRVVDPAEGEPGHMENVSGIDIGPEGNVWVCDWIAGAIIEFDSEGSFVQEFGTTGIFDGQFMHPDTIEVDEGGTIWVVDEQNGRVQWFSEEGTYEGKFGSVGKGEEQFEFEYPAGITSDAEGNLWIADSLNDRVQKWAK